MAAASESTVNPPGSVPVAAHDRWLKRIAIGLAAATAVTGVVIGVRLLRAR